MINILYVGIGPYNGGPVESLLQIISNLDTTKFKPYIFSLPNPHIHITTELKAIDEATILESNVWINNWLQSSGDDHRTTLWHKLKLPGRIIRSLYNGFQIAKIIRANKIDLVHTNIELIIDGALAAFISGRPHIWHIRAPIGRQGAVKHFLGQRFCCWLISVLSTEIIVNSKATLNSISYYINSGKIKLIYNGINPEEYVNNEPHKPLRKLFEIDSNIKIVASVGYLSKIKGGDTFLRIATEILKEFNNVAFVWIGPSIERLNDSFCRSFFHALSENHIENRIFLTGERFDIPSLLSDIDVFLQPMKNGSWSRVVLEAMAASKPVIVLEENGVSEVITNNTNGILARNEEDAVEGIRHLLKNEQLSEMLGENAFSFVMKEFNNQKTASKIMHLYESILSR